MADPRGFLKTKRKTAGYRPVADRVKDWQEMALPMQLEQDREQASRCMNCGIPFCHNACPLGNLIPAWNNLAHAGDWEGAYEQLFKTNPFPEFTGKLCPAPCEDACVLTINDQAVAIKANELTIIEHAFANGWVKLPPMEPATGKKVAVVGSGPAGLAAAFELRRAGHEVTVYEKSQHLGGLIRFGVPDFKMAKHLVERRVKWLEDFGIEFRTGVDVGVDVEFEELRDECDAIALCIGAGKARDVKVPGRELEGVVFAMDYLTAQNMAIAGLGDVPDHLNAHGRKVVILGGGDTGADCYGTAIRQGAKSLLQVDFIDDPLLNRQPDRWPDFIPRGGWSAVHEEGGSRDWRVQTMSFDGQGGRVASLRTCRVRFERNMGIPVPGSEEVIPADLVILAVGFEGAVTDGFGVELDRGRVLVDRRYQTSLPGVFAAGDASMGPTLIVWAIASGRNLAREVDLYLTGRSNLTRSFY